MIGVIGLVRSCVRARDFLTDRDETRLARSLTTADSPFWRVESSPVAFSVAKVGQEARFLATFSSAKINVPRRTRAFRWEFDSAIGYYLAAGILFSGYPVVARMKRNFSRPIQATVRTWDDGAPSENRRQSSDCDTRVAATRRRKKSSIEKNRVFSRFSAGKEGSLVESSWTILTSPLYEIWSIVVRQARASSKHDAVRDRDVTGFR